MDFFKKALSPRTDPRILRGKGTRAARKASSLGKVSIDPMQNQPQKPGLFKFTMTVLYKNLYLLGITLLRRRLRFRRNFKKLRAKMIRAVLLRLNSVWQSVKQFFSKLWTQSKAPFARIRRTYTEVRPDIRMKRAKGKIPFTAYFAVIESVFALIFKIFATIFNYTAPIAAALIFVTIVGRRVSDPMVYTLQYKGEIIGYLENKAEFSAATQDVRSRVTVDGEIAFEIENPHFELLTLSQLAQKKDEGEIPKDASLLERDELADMLIRMSGSEVDEAYGLYIEEEFLGAVIDKDIVLNEFDRIRNNSYKGKPDENVQFTKSIRLKPGLYPAESVVDDEDIIAKLSSKEDTDEIYIAKTGDTPTGIADKTGVPYEVIKELNPEIETKLVEGMEIYTQVAHPFLSVETTYTDIVEEELPFEVIESQNATYARGYRDVYQTGVNGTRRVVYEVKSVDGLERERKEISFEIITHPVDERVTVGINDPQTVVRPPAVTTPPPAQAPGQTAPPAAPAQQSAGFIWPVGNGGGYISCYINGYRGHTGIDIAGAGGTGTPILASASGTVVVSKSNVFGYGRHVIIDHGNGYQTLYAHNSALYVNVGDRVAQGQVIAGMGRTGNATGVHCHFEVRYLGRIQNPVNYVGAR